MSTTHKSKDAIPFEVFASFKRVENGQPILALEPPQWAAATRRSTIYLGITIMEKEQVNGGTST